MNLSTNAQEPYQGSMGNNSDMIWYRFFRYQQDHHLQIIVRIHTVDNKNNNHDNNNTASIILYQGPVTCHSLNLITTWEYLASKEDDDDDTFLWTQPPPTSTSTTSSTNTSHDNTDFYYLVIHSQQASFAIQIRELLIHHDTQPPPQQNKNHVYNSHDGDFDSYLTTTTRNNIPTDTDMMRLVPSASPTPPTTSQSTWKEETIFLHNDTCPNATVMSMTMTGIATLAGVTHHATLVQQQQQQDPVVVGVCGITTAPPTSQVYHDTFSYSSTTASFLENILPGVWYQFHIPTDAAVRISVTTTPTSTWSSSSQTWLSHQLILWKGQDCNQLVCVATGQVIMVSNNNNNNHDQQPSSPQQQSHYILHLNTSGSLE